MARWVRAFHWVLPKRAFGWLAGFFGREIGKIGFFGDFWLILFAGFRLNRCFDNLFREDGNRKIGQQERGCQQPREQLFSMGFAHITTSFESENGKNGISRAEKTEKCAKIDVIIPEKCVIAIFHKTENPLSIILSGRVNVTNRVV